MLFLYITVICIPNILGFPRKIPIDGLFDSDEIQKAFEISIKAVNKNIINRVRNVLLTLRTEKINKNALQLINNGFAAIFGLQDKTTASQSMYDTFDIPHIAARWDSEPKINLYPHLHKYAVLYNNADSLIRINRLLQLPNMNTISAMMFHFGSGLNFRQAMKEVKIFGHRNIIIDCSYDISLDLQTLDLKHYQYSGFATIWKFEGNLGNEELYKIGEWKTNFSFQWKPEYRIPGVDKSLGKKHFLILISNKLNWNTFQTQPYGLLKESSSREADLAITDLTITVAKENVIDFTNPLMNLDKTVLYRISSRILPGLLSFLRPFSKDVWIRVIGAYIVVTALLFVIGKAISTLACQPLAVAWWFFTLIIVTANLVAALSIKSVVWSFQVVEELANQQKIKYGAKINAVNLVLQDSTYEPYAIIYNYMKTHADEVLMKSNKAYRRYNTNYAYFMEFSSIEYIKHRYRNVTRIGGLLDAKGYEIAMIPYHTDLCTVILKLQENGVIGKLQNKWWKEKRGDDTCDIRYLFSHYIHVVL
ncbi:GRIK2 protein, partial [Acromyrmex heyeri]